MFTYLSLLSFSEFRGHYINQQSAIPTPFRHLFHAKGARVFKMLMSGSDRRVLFQARCPLTNCFDDPAWPLCRRPLKNLCAPCVKQMARWFWVGVR